MRDRHGRRGVLGGGGACVLTEHWEQLLVSLALSAIVFVAAEVVKLVGRRREQVHAG